jgi:hypothetical protein
MFPGPIADVLRPRIPACIPVPRITALPGKLINTSLIVVDLWLTGHTNPSRSVGSGTCRPPLQMLQFSLCFRVAIPLN